MGPFSVLRSPLWPESYGLSVLHKAEKMLCAAKPWWENLTEGRGLGDQVETDPKGFDEGDRLA